MARTSRQLLLLFSLLSSSFQFFLHSAQAQKSPADFRSRVSKLRETRTLLSDYLRSIFDGRQQNGLQIKTRTDDKDCEGGCDAFSSASRTANAADSAFVRMLSEIYLKDSPLLNAAEEDSAKFSDAAAEDTWISNVRAKKDRYKNVNALSDKLDHSYVNQFATDLSSLKNVLLQLMQQKVLEQNTRNSSFRRELEDIFYDFPFWESGDLLAETGGTELKQLDERDDDYNFLTDRFSGDDATDEQSGFNFALKENAYKRAEDTESVWDYLGPDPQDFSSQSLSVPAPMDLQESGSQGTHLEIDFSDPLPLSAASFPQWTRDEALRSGLHNPFTGEDPSLDPETKEPPPSRASLSKRLSGPFNHQVFVHGHGNRRRVLLPQMRKFPFSNIARLSTGCTGTLVTPRHVLTAAHCVHNGFGFRANLEKLKIQIPDTMGFKNYYAQKITIPTGWLRDPQSGAWSGAGSGKRAVYDYAVVHLTLAVAGKTRFLPLAVPRPEVLQMDFHFLAFPQDDQRLWRSVCLASYHLALGDGNLIMTRCDAAVGNSGAAVFIQDPNHGGLKVVGVLSNTMPVGQHRYSIITALTWPKLNHICQELDVLGQVYSVCPPPYMRRPPSSRRQMELQVVPFFGKRVSQKPGDMITPPGLAPTAPRLARTAPRLAPTAPRLIPTASTPGKHSSPDDDVPSSVWKRAPAERSKSAKSIVSPRTMFRRQRRSVGVFPPEGRPGVPDTRSRFGFRWREEVPGIHSESASGRGTRDMTENAPHFPKVRGIV